MPNTRVICLGSALWDTIFRVDRIPTGAGKLLPTLAIQGASGMATGEHFRNAGVEFLKGFRELLDLQIEALSPKETKGTKLNVE